MKLISLLGWAASGVFLTLFIVFAFKFCNVNSNYKIVKAERDSCWAVKHTIDTIVDTVEIKNDSIIYKPELIHSERIIEVPIDCDSLKSLFFKRNTFAGKFSNSDFELNYGIVVSENELEKVVFPTYNVFRKTIYDKKVVDTCIMKKPKIKNKLYLFAEVGTDFKSVTNVRTGIHWIFAKDNLILSPNVMVYDFHVGGKISYDLSIGVKIR